MKQIRIVHQTEYHYHLPVKLGPHRAMLRPREGHDVHIQSCAIGNRAAKPGGAGYAIFMETRSP